MRNTPFIYTKSIKLVCSCGNITKFKENDFEIEDCIDADYDIKKFSIQAEHDEVFIGCEKCGKSIHIFT